MLKNKSVDILLKVFTGVLLAVAFVLTFTVSDYYIFNKFNTYNPLFIICQWVKKSGLLLLPLAVYFGVRSCADIAKYFLPIFVVVSLFTYGQFFDITMMTESASAAEKVYANINEFIPKTAHMLLFFAESGFMLGACALLFLRDGFKACARSFGFLPLAVAAVTPLNIFENFFNRNLYDKWSIEYRKDSFLLFKNFTIWHALILIILLFSAIGCYYYLKKKSRDKQDKYLAALAIALLIQYHSKDSVVMGDGYNSYRTLFACIPLFICNIGVYVTCLSVFLKKRVLYSISFFVHAAGALSVFVYFGKEELSNLGIFYSYSLLYLCVTHGVLLILAVLPTALGHYKFKPKDAIIPLIYYCIVIVVAAVSSALVTSASMEFSYGGYTLSESEWLYPNYAFTQINPTLIPEPRLPVTVWRCELNIAYLMILYGVYVGLFYAMNGAYYTFLAIRRRVLKMPASVTELSPAEPFGEVEAEAAATEDCEA